MSVTQNETGGKDLLLKIEKDISATITSVSSTITSTTHGLAVGDLIKTESPGTVSELTSGQFYFVIEVPTSSTFKVSATPSGSAISFAHNATQTWEAYLAIGGLRAKSVSLSVNGVKGTNHDSDQWEVLIDGAGISKVSVSGSGVYTNADSFQLVEAAILARALTRLCFIDVKNLKAVHGYFMVNSLDESGSYDGEGQFSMKCESSGEIEIDQLT